MMVYGSRQRSWWARLGLWSSNGCKEDGGRRQPVVQLPAAERQNRNSGSHYKAYRWIYKSALLSLVEEPPVVVLYISAAELIAAPQMAGPTGSAASLEARKRHPEVSNQAEMRRFESCLFKQRRKFVLLLLSLQNRVHVQRPVSSPNGRSGVEPLRSRQLLMHPVSCMASRGSPCRRTKGQGSA